MTNWRDFYNAAVMESDWTKVEQRIQTAESEIRNRLALYQSVEGTQEERDTLVDALNGLETLRANVASWLERQRDREAQP
jgi:hypothetical protein